MTAFDLEDVEEQELDPELWIEIGEWVGPPRGDDNPPEDEEDLELGLEELGALLDEIEAVEAVQERASPRRDVLQLAPSPDEARLKVAQALLASEDSTHQVPPRGTSAVGSRAAGSHKDEALGALLTTARHRAVSVLEERRAKRSKQTGGQR